MNEKDIEVRYRKLSLEYIVNTGYVPAFISFDVGKLINYKDFEKEISLKFLFDIRKREYCLEKENKDFMINYINEVMKKSYVRYGL